MSVNLLSVAFRICADRPRRSRGSPLILKILIVGDLAVAAILIFAATRSNTINVQRSITIDAPPEEIFALIDDFHYWPRWAPQDRARALMTRTYGLAERGLGAVSDRMGPARPAAAK
jgi:Polyketide cyclase / dehydrase and lipid transport